MSNVFFTSDLQLHYQHHAIIKYCNRPFAIKCSSCNEWNKDCKDCKALTIPNQEAELIKRWNAKVNENDLDYNFGDFIWTDDADLWVSIVERLKGRQRILVGNHDKLICDRNGVAKPYANLPQQIRNLVDNGQIEWIKNYYEEKIHGQYITMMHFPLAAHHKSMYGSWMLHGHTHGTHETSWPCSTKHGRIADVGVDCHDYAPVSFDELKVIMGSCGNELKKEFENA